ncbi:alpha/beta hydrolase [Nonomuraea sp. NPDC050540]|uniref:alpha/beta hydrolase n=1 Tax=Nonomuraea sp. NPDC050540 TaxID=3364367 RepID=UPI0037B39916
MLRYPAASLLAGALLLTGLAAPAAQAATPAISWGACAQKVAGMECGTLTVPLDHADPKAGTLDVAVSRFKATGRRIGSLVMNFGGGGNGVAILGAAHAQYAALRAGYDLIGFDPRGSGGTAPVRCGDGRAFARLVELNPGYTKAFRRETAAFARACAKDSARILPHAGTADTARDLDLLRAALGEDKLHYYGKSYGSALGGVYATLFPGRLGRMVLDAGVEPRQSLLQLERGVTLALQTGYERFLADCARRACELGKNPGRTVERLLKRLEHDPLQVGKRRLGRALATSALTFATTREAWPGLSAAIGQAVKGDGETLLAVSDYVTQPLPDGTYGSYAGTATNLAVYCRDRIRPGEKELRRDQAELSRLSPVFGPIGVTSGFLAAACRYWPVGADAEGRTVAHTGATPVVVIGSRKDVAAPLSGAASLARQLRTGILVTYEGDMHGAYPDGGPCVTGAVEGYLLRGERPGRNLSCPAVR